MFEMVADPGSSSGTKTRSSLPSSSRMSSSNTSLKVRVLKGLIHDPLPVQREGDADRALAIRFDPVGEERTVLVSQDHERVA
jgi:hypothetical protein